MRCKGAQKLEADNPEQVQMSQGQKRKDLKWLGGGRGQYKAMRNMRLHEDLDSFGNTKRKKSLRPIHRKMGVGNLR